MKHLYLLFLLIVYASIIKSQEVKFGFRTPIVIKIDNEDKSISIPVLFTNIIKNKSISLTFSVNKELSSASEEKDFVFSTKSPIELDSANSFSSKIDLVIKPKNLIDSIVEISLKISFEDYNGNKKESYYSIILQVTNDGSDETPQLKREEKINNRTISLDLFTGGNFDFFDALKIQHLGGELIIKANDIYGKDSHWGFYSGLFNFQNLSFDSSNLNIRTQLIRIDTGAYIRGVTKYIKRSFVDHLKITTNQWGYYFNPTFRFGSNKSDFINIYASLHIEGLRTLTKIAYKTDTISFSDTTNIPLNSPVFQSGKGFLLQNYTDISTDGYFGVSLPIWLNAKDKFKFYFDPGIGYASNSYSTFQIAANGTRLNRININKWKPYYLFHFRMTEQFTSLNITIGGEIRGLMPTYAPSINVYLGVRANLVKWFKKE